MGFNAAREYLSTYLKDHGEQLRKGERVQWALNSLADTSEIDTLFDRQEENVEWIKLNKSESTASNQMMGIRAKIAWLCGCNRDIRVQFACAKGCRPRVHHDHHRLALVEYIYAGNGLTRMQDIMDDRAKKIAKD